MVADDMKKKWIKRSDRILLYIIILWFIGAAWGIALTTASFAVQVWYSFAALQATTGGYYGYGGMDISLDANSILIYICAPVTGGLITWLIKNMSEANTRSKLNPEYLKTHPPDDEPECEASDPDQSDIP